MKKVTLIEALFSRRKDKKVLEKELGCKFIRINTSKEGYNAGYETSRIQTFINKFKDRQLKKIKQKIKRTRRQNRKIDRSNNSIKSKCLKSIVKKILPTI